MARFSAQQRRGRKALRGAGRDQHAVMPLTASLDALGSQSWADLGVQRVPVDAIVGSAGRTDEFDRSFRPARSHQRARWEAVDAALNVGAELPPVQLVQLGELFFVVDGHHRISVARARGMEDVAAVVKKVCTVAYACRCLTLLDLPAKAAEREFLERFPLPDDVRPWLWLDDLADWERMHRLAEEWVYGPGGLAETHAKLDEVVARWWDHEVVPTAARCHPDRRADLTEYLCAVRERDPDDCCHPETLGAG